jgi:hypothetical protein
MFKKRGMRWVGHIVQMREKRNIYVWKNQKERDH